VTDYTRVTIQGEGRKADLVLPDDEPIAAVLPEVLSLLDETTDRSSRPVVLMTTVGEQLSPALTLAEQDVEHGSILRLVRVDEAPPPPEVADVTDLMGEAAETRSDAWRPVWATAAAAAVAAVAGFLAGPAALLDGYTPSQVGIGLLVLLVLATVSARRRRTGPAVVLTAAVVGGLAVVTGLVLAQVGLDHPGATMLVWFGLTGLAVGLVAAIGFKDVPLALGGGAALVLTGAWILMHQASMQPLHVAAWTAVVGVVLLGLLPGIAMSASGLTGLDDRVVEGQRVSRPAVERAVDATHRGLTWATVAVVLPTSLGAWLLASSDEPAAQGICAAVGLVLLLRTQVLPLAPQRLALLAGGVVPLATLAFTGLMSPGSATLASFALIVVLAVVVGVRASENTRARLRRFAGVLEMIAVIALVPLLMWLLGIFADLVSTFTS
jgi:type VII secretion integral membrane protein EccD